MNYAKSAWRLFLKYFLYYPLVVFASGLFLGVLLGLGLDAIHNYFWIVSVIALFLIFLLIPISCKKSLVLFLLAIFVGVWFISNRELAYEKHKAEAVNCISNTNVSVEVVIDDVYFDKGNTKLTLKDVVGDGFSYNGRILAEIEGKFDLYSGQKLRLEIILKKPENLNPDFDYEKYLFQKDIHLLGEVKNFEIIESGNNVVFLLGKFRSDVVTKVRTLLGEPENSLLLGLTLGYRAEFDPSFELALHKTGTTHIVAISGSNVILIVGFVLALIQRFSRKIRLFIIPIFLFLLCVLTGCTPPVIRASLVIFFVMLAEEFGREGTSIIAICFAFIVMVIYNPFSLWDVSFELSFMSSLGLICGAKIFNKKSEDGSFVLDSILDVLKSTFWVFLFTLPITVVYFGEFSLLSFVSNIFVLPVVGVATMLGLVNILFVMVNNSLGLLFSYLVYVPLHIIQKIIFFISKSPIGIVTLPFEVPWLAFISYYLVLILIIIYIDFRKNIGRSKNGEI